MSVKQIGIFGGSFNPIHNGHIELGRQLCSLAGLDELWFLVSPQNPFKVSADDLAPEEQRFAIAECALTPYRQLVASRFEFSLPRPSFMVNTLEKLRDAYPDSEFALVIGADNWLSFDRWHNYEEILAHHRVLVYPRSGYDVDEASLPSGVTLVRTPLYDVSSTLIRRRIASGESIDDMVPESILTILHEVYG